jgi:hypothetical protein
MSTIMTMNDVIEARREAVVKQKQTIAILNEEAKTHSDAGTQLEGSKKAKIDTFEEYTSRTSKTIKEKFPAFYDHVAKESVKNEDGFCLLFDLPFTELDRKDFDDYTWPELRSLVMEYKWGEGNPEFKVIGTGHFMALIMTFHIII